MSERLQELIDQIRSEMEELTDDGRTEVFASMMSGYCRDCGAETHGRICYCHDPKD